MTEKHQWCSEKWQNVVIITAGIFSPWSQSANYLHEKWGEHQPARPPSTSGSGLLPSFCSSGSHTAVCDNLKSLSPEEKMKMGQFYKFLRINGGKTPFWYKNLTHWNSSDEVVTENLHVGFQDRDKCRHHHHCRLTSTAGWKHTNLIAQVHDVVYVLFRHLGSHGDLSSQLHLGLNFLRQRLRQVGRGYICAIA